MNWDLFIAGILLPMSGAAMIADGVKVGLSQYHSRTREEIRESLRRNRYLSLAMTPIEALVFMFGVQKLVDGLT